MKKVLIALKNMEIGGIEKSSIELIRYLYEHGCQITLVLEEKKGELLKKIHSNIEVIEYKPCSITFIPIRKYINLIKRIMFILKFKNKFDISISYTTYSLTDSFIARKASKKSILWCHADYLSLYNGENKKVKEFFKKINYKRFWKIVFVSESAKKNFLKIFPKQENVFVCNNLINSEDIVKKSKEKIKMEYDKTITTFLNVGRHDENQKKISRIIEASYLLKKNKYKFRVIFVGDGDYTAKYKKMVKEKKLEENIIFVNKSLNPYPYFKISDCVIISSEYEGYPVVFLESYVMNKPIITTKVSDYEDIKNGRGIVVEKNIESIYNAMKNFIINGYQIKGEFNANFYTQNIEKKIMNIIEL